MKIRNGSAAFVAIMNTESAMERRIAARNGISTEQAHVIARNLGNGRRVAVARAHAAQLAAIHAAAPVRIAAMADAFRAIGR